MVVPSHTANNRASTHHNNSIQINDTTKTKIQKYLTNCKSLYSCIYCRTHLANHDELVSRSFQGTFGRAYLFNSVINTTCGVAVQRDLNTGPHAVADIYCANCKRTLGWKYERAFIETQKYKEGKYIIELAHVVRENRHLEMDKGEMVLLGRSSFGRSSTSNRFRDSMSPPPLSEISSPTSSSNGEFDDVDEELMFPFYDEIFSSSGSSCPNDLSHCHHNRMRRSLYSDSTPYDWKYSTASSSSGSSSTSSPPIQQIHKEGQIISTSSLSPSSSSALYSTMVESTRTSTHKKKSYQDNNIDAFTRDGDEQERDSDDDSGTCDNDTQFKFEADAKIDNFGTFKRGSISSNELNNNKQCDQTNSGNAADTSGVDGQILGPSRGDKGNSIASSSSSSSSNDTTHRSRDEEASCTLVSDNTICPSKLVDQTRDNSFNLDDEQFYDCYTDTSSSNTNNNRNDDVVSH